MWQGTLEVIVSRKFTIEEIREYMDGWKLMPDGTHNDSLANAITQIEDEEDGIEAVTRRIESRKRVPKYTEAEMYNTFKTNLENGEMVCHGVTCRGCPFWSVVNFRGNCGAFESGHTPTDIEALKRSGRYPKE
jgi:hypothetical protein